LTQPKLLRHEWTLRLFAMWDTRLIEAEQN